MPPTNPTPDDDNSLDLDRLTRVRPGRSGGVDDDSVIAIRPSREAYIPEATDREHFSRVDYVAVYVDETYGYIAVEPIVEGVADEDEKDLLSLGRDEGKDGANLSLKSAFNRFGVGPDELPLEETTHLPLEERGLFRVVDVSEILPGEYPDETTNDAQDDEARADGGSTTVPSSRAASSIRTDGPPVAEAYDFDRLEDLAEEAPSLREFAGEIDATIGKARKVAMVAGVYDKLPDRPGAYRGGVDR